jgi:hypothetical protein
VPSSRSTPWCTARVACSMVILPALTSSSVARPSARHADSSQCAGTVSSKSPVAWPRRTMSSMRSRTGGLLLVFALCLSWAWTALGLTLRTPQAVMSTGTVVLFPLTLASNVFVQSRTMPGWLQAFVRVNPVSHLVTAERGLLAGYPAAGQIAWVLLAAAAVLAVFAPLTGYLYARRA